MGGSSPDVGTDDPVPVVHGKVGQRGRDEGAGVVVGEVEASELPDRLMDGGLDRRGVGDVEAQEPGLAAQLLDLADGVGAVEDVADRDRCAARGEGQCAAAPDPARGSGDERDPAGEVLPRGAHLTDIPASTGMATPVM